ncbi:hypothetical protein CAC42_559 [Sphaceloma murrayae]|uniref:Uncharacterized protein n=1 Tax=Sphaceloma murrayae TaxID=2082308 RepID=A0A2K1R3U4_9PEZI|nr:hypothetical protein CAC42_559 [Sphaceloma murrayae]
MLRKVGDKYPASLNVFHAGTGLTTWIGSMRMGTIFYFIYQSLVRAPALDVHEASNSLLWSSATIILSSLPMLSTQLLLSPFTATINVLIPPEARRNEKTLRQWSERPRDDTLIEFTTLRFLPFPKRKTVRLEDLRLLKPRAFRIAQFEYVPPKLRESSNGNAIGWLKGLIGGRRTFYVRDGLKYTQSTRGPGVWDNLTKVIFSQSGYKMPVQSRIRPALRSVGQRRPPGQDST